MEFSEYLQWDGGPDFLHHPVQSEWTTALTKKNNRIRFVVSKQNVQSMATRASKYNMYIVNHKKVAVHLWS